jgi:hypothetical protein
LTLALRDFVVLATMCLRYRQFSKNLLLRSPRSDCGWLGAPCSKPLAALRREFLCVFAARPHRVDGIEPEHIRNRRSAKLTSGQRPCGWPAAFIDFDTVPACSMKHKATGLKEPAGLECCASAGAWQARGAHRCSEGG